MGRPAIEMIGKTYGEWEGTDSRRKIYSQRVV